MKHLSFVFALGFGMLFSQSSATGADFASTVMDATFKLFHPKSTATCFILSKENAEKTTDYFLVTSAHVLEQMNAEEATVVLRKREENGSFSRVDHKIAIRKDDKNLWVKHKDHDIAVLKLTAKLPVPVAALPISMLADSDALAASGVHVCSPLFLFTFPERFEANGAGFPVARGGIFSSPPLLPSEGHPTFLADFTTFSGDSGSPVFIKKDAETPLIVGLVLGKHHHDEKIKTEYGEQVISHPLSMGIILHARYILDTLGENENSETPKKSALPIP